jgi:hypothetical protein
MPIRIIILIAMAGSTAMDGSPPEIWWKVMLRVVARECATLKCIDIAVGF